MPEFHRRAGSVSPATSLAICRANLWLRTADRVVVEVGSFAASDFGQLFDRTYALPWETWIQPDAAFPVNGRLGQIAAFQRAGLPKDREKGNRREAPAPPTTRRRCRKPGIRYTVEVALLDNQATLTLDTSGAGLHKRGYRTAGRPRRSSKRRSPRPWCC